MSIEANKALFRRLIEEVENSGNLDLLDDLMAADYVHHDEALPPEIQKGREAYKQVVSMFRAGFPDLHGTIEDLIAEGHKVVGRWTFRGTHQGALMGIPPTGKQVTMTGIHILRIADEQIAEGWINFDALGMMQQLGVIPAPEQAAL